jgi:hypothetical protein
VAGNPAFADLASAAAEQAFTPEQERELSPEGIIPGGLKAGLYGTLSAGAETLGFGDVADRLAKASEENAAPELQDYRNIKGAGDLTRYVAAQGAQAMGSMAPTMIPGLGAANLAGRAAMGLRLGTRAITAARTAGGAAGGYGAAFPVEMGETLREAKAIGMDTSDESVRTVARDKAIVNAALEAAVPAVLGGKLLKGAGLARGAVVTAGAEGATEGAQEISGLFAQSRLTGKPVDLNDPNTRARLVNAVVGGAVGGGSVSLPIGALEKIGSATDSVKLPTLGRLGESTTELFKDATGKAIESTSELYKSAKDFALRQVGIAPSTTATDEAKSAFDEIRSQAQVAASQGGDAFATLREQVNAKYAGAPLDVRHAAAQALLAGSLGNVYDDVTNQAKAALAKGQEAVDALKVQYENARPEVKQALAQALASGAPANVGRAATSAAETVASTLERVKSLADKEQRTILLDTVAANIAKARNTVSDWASSVAKLVTSEPNVVEQPKQHIDIFGENPDKVASFLSGAAWFPRSIADAKQAVAFMADPANRASAARYVFNSLPAEYRNRLANPNFDDVAVQATVGGLYAEHVARARMERVGDLAAEVQDALSSSGQQRMFSRALTQKDLNLASEIADQIRAVYSANVAVAMTAQKGTAKKAARVAQGVAERAQQAKEVNPLSQDTIADLAKSYAWGLREIFSAVNEKGETTPSVFSAATDSTIAMYEELADVLDSHESAMGILETAREAYGSNMDLDTVATIRDSDKALVQRYAQAQLDDREVSKVLQGIELLVAGVPIRDMESMRLINVAFGGDEGRVLALMDRIAANRDSAYGTQASEAFNAPAAPVEDEAAGAAQAAEEGTQVTPGEEIESDTGYLAPGYGEEEAAPRISFGYSSSLVPFANRKAVEGIIERLRQQNPTDVEIQAVPLSVLTEEDTGGVDPVEYVTNFLDQSTDKRATQQLAELTEVLDDPVGLEEVLNKYAFFRYGEGVSGEELSARDYAAIKSTANDKGSAEGGTLSLLDPKGNRQLFSAVELVRRVMFGPGKAGVAGTDSLPANIARSLSAGLGMLAERTGATGFVALRSPKKITGGVVPTPFNAPKPTDEGEARSRNDAQLLLSDIAVGGNEKPMVQRLLDWAATKVASSRDKFDKQRGTRVPDTSISFHFNGQDYTLDVSSSAMQIRSGDEVVAGPVLRPDLVVYTTKGGKKITFAETKTTPEPAKIGDYLGFKARRKAEDMLSKAIDKKLAAAVKGGNKALETQMRELQGRADPLTILDDMSDASYDELTDHPLYPVYEMVMDEVGPSIRNAAWREYQQQESFTYGAARTSPETVITDEQTDEQARAEPIEGPRSTSVALPSTKIEQLLGGRREMRPSSSGARPVTIGSRALSDLPTDVRDRVTQILDPMRRKLAKEGAKLPKSVEEFVQKTLLDKTLKSNPAVQQAQEVIDSYYAMVRSAESRTGRRQQITPPRGTVRSPEMESFGMMRQTARKREAQPRTADEFGISPEQVMPGARTLATGEKAGVAQQLGEFGADQIPEGVRGTREPMTATRSLARFRRQVDMKDEDIRALHDRVKKAFSHPELTQSMKQELIRIINRSAMKPDAITAKLDELSDRIRQNRGAAKTQGRSGGAPTKPGKPEAPAPAKVGITIHSGGAAGADTVFGKIGSEFGLSTVAHSFAGHRPQAGSGTPRVHSATELRSADKLLSAINAKYLKRRFPPANEFVANLLRRNYFQVKDSDAVIAISNFDEKGVVKGGTGWAAYMGVELSKPTFVFDQTNNQWHTWQAGKWVPTALPGPYQRFAGVGTREINAAGEAAVRAYLSQFKEATTQAMRSDMAPSGERVPRGTQAEVVREIERLLGAEIKTEWVKNLGHAGESVVDENLQEIIRLATTAANPMGTAHHEALHILLERLKTLPGGDKLVQALIDATSTPAVRKRLEEALAGEPGALRQLDEPLERVAYAYQLMRADPSFRLAPAAKTWFQKLSLFLRRVVGKMTSAQVADRVFDAFSAGTFSDPMVMREWLGNRLDSIIPDAAITFMNKHPIFTMLNAVKSSGDAFMRETGIPAYIRIAEMAQAGLGSAGGFLPERMRRMAQWGNLLSDTVKGHTDAEIAAAHENLLLKKPPSNELERKIRKILDSFHEYLTKSGVERPVGHGKEQTWEPIPYRKDYYPGVWDAKYVANNLAAFDALLKKHDFGNARARGGIAENILAGGVEDTPAQGDFERGFTPYMQAASARKLGALYDDPESLPFRSKNLIETMQRYLYQGVHRAEYVQRFGNRGEILRGLLADGKAQGATPEQQRWANMYAHAVEGTLGASISPQLREAQGWLLLYQNLRLLPLSIFSSFVDPLNIVMRTGSFTTGAKAFVRGMKLAFRGMEESDIARIAKLMGTIDEKSALETMGNLSGSVYMTKNQRAISDKFFRVIGMTGWNNGMRLAATEAAMEFLIEHSAQPKQHSARWLAELGLRPGDVQTDAQGALKITPDANFSRAQAERVRSGINKWVNSVIMRPTAADRPIWASSPYFALVFHLKQFAYSFHRNINKFVFREQQHGNYWPLMVATSYIPTMLAADFLRGMIQGLGEEPEYKKRWTAGDRVWNAVERSGLTGVPQFALDSAEDARRGQTGLETILGPTLGQTSQALQTIAGSKDAGAFFTQALPGQVVFKHW